MIIRYFSEKCEGSAGGVNDFASVTGYCFVVRIYWKKCVVLLKSLLKGGAVELGWFSLLWREIRYVHTHISTVAVFMSLFH